MNGGTYSVACSLFSAVSLIMLGLVLEDTGQESVEEKVHFFSGSLRLHVDLHH